MPDGRNEDGEVLHTAREHGADEEPQESGSEAELRSERGTDQRSGAGDGGEVVSEENPLWRRNVVVAVFERVRGCSAAVVKRERLGGDERAVITVSEGVNTKGAEYDRKGVHDLPPGPGSVLLQQESLATSSESARAICGGSRGDWGRVRAQVCHKAK